MAACDGSRDNSHGNLMFDAQIAAVCREHGIDRILTNDRDFMHFGTLRAQIGPAWRIWFLHEQRRMEVWPGKSAPRRPAQCLGKSCGPAFCDYDARNTRLKPPAYINPVISAFRNDDVNGSTPKGDEFTATNPLYSSCPASCPIFRQNLDFRAEAKRRRQTWSMLPAREVVWNWRRRKLVQTSGK